MGGIKISEKHGVNPSLGICFWCGEHTNEIILFGKIKDDKEAPREACVSMEPCDKCKENMSMGITIMEATNTYDGPKPTGRWWVLTEDAIKRIFNSEDQLENVLSKRKCFMEPETIKLIGLEGYEK